MPLWDLCGVRSLRWGVGGGEGRPRAPSRPGWEDPLEEEMATHSSILAWKMPWTEEPGGLGTGWSSVNG